MVVHMEITDKNGNSFPVNSKGLEAEAHYIAEQTGRSVEEVKRRIRDGMPLDSDQVRKDADSEASLN